MFACLYAHRGSVSRWVTVAESFTPRFEVVGPLVMLDVSGLSRLFGSADEIGAHLDRAMATSAGMAREQTSAGTAREQKRTEQKPFENGGRGGSLDPPGKQHCAIAATQTIAALVALGQPGLTVVAAGDEARRLASLPVTVLADLERIARTRRADSFPVGARQGSHENGPPRVRAGGWQHPRLTHQASQTRRLVRQAATRARKGTERRPTRDETEQKPTRDGTEQKPTLHDATKETQALVDVLRRWGIHTLGALAALPSAEVSERLGQPGTRWQRMAMGEDERPLVPWIADVPFEATLDLEWPLEGLEPLSFVLARLFEPLVVRLERADRGAAVMHTTLRLVTRTTYVRTLQLPAPMRDAKTLRALVLLDLESHPPSAAVDRVQIVIEPTPARVLQWELFERAQPSPEQVSTLLARLTALAGDGHVGSPRLLDSWKPGAFEMGEFRVTDARSPDARPPLALSRVEGWPPLLHAALRRFRWPVPARVTVREGRPVRVQSDRHGVLSGAVTHAAGPWRTSGQWWDLAASTATPASGHHGVQGPWDRDEWDVELTGGLVYRIFVEREIGQWFIEGLID